MIGSKVIDILKTFSKEELKDFELFLSSPFFNRRKSLMDFFKFVVKYHPAYDYDFSKTDRIAKALKEKQAIDVNHTVKLFSFLFKELERYIITKKVEKDKLYSQNTLSLYYNHNNLVTLFEHSCTALEEDLKNVPRYNILVYNYNENKCSFLSKSDFRKGDINYIPLSDSLDAFYYYNKLRLYCLMLNRSQVIGYDYNEQYQHALFDPKLIDRLNIEEIKIYYKIFTEFQKPLTVDVYNEILNSIEQIDKFLAVEDLRIIYTILANFSKSIYPDKEEYYHKLFYLYKRQLEVKAIYYDNKIHIGHLKNIVILAINTKNLKWAEDFLIQHKDLILPKEENYESFYYLMAEVHFAKKEFARGLDCLALTKSNDILIKLAIKRMYLKIFFELKEAAIFESNIASYKVYLSREKEITEDKKEAEKKFVNFLSLIWKNQFATDLKKVMQIRNKIESEQVSDKRWLLQVCDDTLVNSKLIRK